MEKALPRLKREFFIEKDFIRNVGTLIFVYPFVGKSKTSAICHYVTISLVLLVSTQLAIQLYQTRFKDWFQVINIAPNLGVCWMAVVKYSKMRKKVYQDIFDHYQNAFWEVVEDSHDHRTILNKYTKTTRLVARYDFYYGIVLIVAVNMFPKIVMFCENNILGKDTQYLYPFDGWYPFDKIKWYYTAYIWESVMTSIVILVYGFANVLHISYTRYICLELKILGNNMQKLITSEDAPKITKIKQNELNHRNIKKKLKNIIKRHQLLLKLCSDLDQALGDGMLMTYLFGSVFIGLTIFTATVVEDLYMTVRYFSFFCSLLLDVFVQCILGQLLIDHSAKLEHAIYFTDWPNADMETKKMLLILLIRAQKPITYTAKGYLIMNLNTFSGICRLSYQLFNLLRTAYTEL